MKRLDYYGSMGPACCDKETLIKMIEKGMTGIRLNLSHKSLADSAEWIKTYQEAAAECGKEPKLMIDLQGPEVRIGDLKNPIQLTAGETVEISDENDLAIEAEIRMKLRSEMVLKLDDGCIWLQVESCEDGKCICKVLKGGKLTSRKSLAIDELEIHNPTLTEADYDNLLHAQEYGVSEVLLPFVRGKEDVMTLRNELKRLDADIKLFAKIESMEGVENLEEIVAFCDCVVIARGDLGNAVTLPRLPILQQEIAKTCRENNRPIVVVTQMLQSMMKSAVPTRAEVNDIFHAVCDGASVLMLTGETAMGDYPVDAIDMLVQTGEAAREYVYGK